MSSARSPTYPGTCEYLLETYAEATKEDRLSDLLVGYLDPTDHVPQAAQVQPGVQAEKNDDDEEEENKGPDPEEAKKRFTKLKRAHSKATKLIAEKGRDHKETVAAMEKLAEAFSPFKLVPRHFDEMVEMARDGLGRVRRQERVIMTSPVCVRLVCRVMCSAKPIWVMKPASPGSTNW